LSFAVTFFSEDGCNTGFAVAQKISGGGSSIYEDDDDGNDDNDDDQLFTPPRIKSAVN
jgi:hypothetical protein